MNMRKPMSSSSTMKFWIMIWLPKRFGWKTQIIETTSYKDTLLKLQSFSFLEGHQRVDFRNKIRSNISRRDYRRNLIQTISRLSEVEAKRIVLDLLDLENNYLHTPGGQWLSKPWWPYQDQEWKGSRFVTFI